MSKETIIPIFRAKRPHGETIEGDFFVDGDPEQHRCYIDIRGSSWHHVKIETLEISVDGKNFFTMEQLKEKLNA